MRNYFAAFKSVCFNFCIISDTDNNGLIDSLELFAGIAIFADIQLSHKIRCISFTILFFLICLTLMSLTVSSLSLFTVLVVLVIKSFRTILTYLFCERFGFFFICFARLKI